MSSKRGTVCNFLEVGMGTLPVHFFTIVLNGEPFIRAHIETFARLPFDWHWHIVEGVAELKHDTAWSVSLGGKVTDALHRGGRSKDGTTEYLDELARRYPKNVTVYRKPLGQFWDGKLEMVRAPLANISNEALLWQLDSDEVWTTEQIVRMRDLFLRDPSRTAAWFWCWYYVGPGLIISSRNCYAQNPQQEWLRVWRYQPGMQWIRHEPPTLAAPRADGQWVDAGRERPFLHQETEAAGLVFHHYSYVTEAQLEFKEVYYGYRGAVQQWRALQSQERFPQRLRDYFPWVTDDTEVDRAARFGVKPYVAPGAALPTRISELSQTRRIALDGCFFQLCDTGISRLWAAIMRAWTRSGFAKEVLVIDRARSAPRLPDFEYVDLPAYNARAWKEDRRVLQEVLDRMGVELFVSTYYSTPETTPSALMLYDMIPEVFNLMDNGDPQWVEKRRAIAQAQSYFCISENTKRDLVRLYPRAASRPVRISYPGIDTGQFFKVPAQEVISFHEKHQIARPYFLLVGPARGYKNIEMFFEAVKHLPSAHGLEAILVGGHISEAEIAALNPAIHWRRLKLSDADLRAAYAGALALVYPSRYEGFGLPILEAQACNCPVITTPWSSIPEVGGSSVLYVKDPLELADALAEVQKPSIQGKLLRAGRENLARFSWDEAARVVAEGLLEDLGAKQQALPSPTLAASAEFFASPSFLL